MTVEEARSRHAPIRTRPLRPNTTVAGSGTPSGASDWLLSVSVPMTALLALKYVITKGASPAHVQTNTGRDTPPAWISLSKKTPKRVEVAVWEFFSKREPQAGVAPGPVLEKTGAIQPTLVITYFNASNAVI